jgi:hypothetical protein
MLSYMTPPSESTCVCSNSACVDLLIQVKASIGRPGGTAPEATRRLSTDSVGATSAAAIAL